MNIHEAMFKGNGKAALPENGALYCIFVSGKFSWGTSSCCQDSHGVYVVVDRNRCCIDCGRKVTWNYIGESKAPHETIPGKLKYDTIRELLENTIDGCIARFEFNTARDAIKTLKEFLELSPYWTV